MATAEDDLLASINDLLAKLSHVESESAALRSSCNVLEEYSVELFLLAASQTAPTAPDTSSPSRGIAAARTAEALQDALLR